MPNNKGPRPNNSNFNPPYNPNQPQEPFKDYTQATAPYNFVPLPLSEAARTVEGAPDFSSFGWQVEDENENENEQGRELYSGYFEFSLKTLTPLYIRSTLTQTEFEQAQPKKPQEENSQEERPPKAQFFSPGFKTQAGRARPDIRPYLRIPGSSLRGMTRTLVEILSEGFFDEISDRPMFYRAVFDKSSIGEKYSEYINGPTLPSKVKVGYIYKLGTEYFIRPAKKSFNAQLFRVKQDVVVDDVTNPLPANKKIAGLEWLNENYKWKKQRISFKPTTPGKNSTIARLSSNDIDTGRGRPVGAGWEEGYFLATGWMDSKQWHWVITMPDNAATPIKIPDEDIKAYKASGLTPKVDEKEFSVLPETEGEDPRPCFYIEREDDKGKKRISFGHTPFFRLQYWHTPQDLIPGKLKVPPKPVFDMAQAIFGVAAGDKRGKSFAGRVYFEDAFFDRAENADNPIEEDEAKAKVLGSPKPTTFQHYLSQDEAIKAFRTGQYPKKEREDKRKKALKHWDSPGAKLRGYKLYWHRSGQGWQEEAKVLDYIEKQGKEETQRQVIRPVKEGVWFRFRVRFTNLRDYELGALATALDLPKDCAHKLGMGKPLGLGSVHLHCEELRLINRADRYTKLLETDASGQATASWFTGESSGDISGFKKAFAAWLLGKDKNVTDPEVIWQVGRLRDLHRILRIEGKPADSQTRYLRIPDPYGINNQNEYSERHILPTPTQLGKAEANPLPEETKSLRYSTGALPPDPDPRLSILGKLLLKNEEDKEKPEK